MMQDTMSFESLMDYVLCEEQIVAFLDAKPETPILVQLDASEDPNLMTGDEIRALLDKATGGAS